MSSFLSHLKCTPLFQIVSAVPTIFKPLSLYIHFICNLTVTWLFYSDRPLLRATDFFCLCGNLEGEITVHGEQDRRSSVAGCDLESPLYLISLYGLSQSHNHLCGLGQSHNLFVVWVSHTISVVWVSHTISMWFESVTQSPCGLSQ